MLYDSGLVGSLGEVPQEQKMLKGHLPRVIYHQVYVRIRRGKFYACAVLLLVLVLMFSCDESYHTVALLCLVWHSVAVVLYSRQYRAKGGRPNSEKKPIPAF